MQNCCQGNTDSPAASSSIPLAQSNGKGVHRPHPSFATHHPRTGAERWQGIQVGSAPCCFHRSIRPECLLSPWAPQQAPQMGCTQGEQDRKQAAGWVRSSIGWARWRRLWTRLHYLSQGKFSHIREIYLTLTIKISHDSKSLVRAKKIPNLRWVEADYIQPTPLRAKEKENQRSWYQPVCGNQRWPKMGLAGSGAHSRYHKHLAVTLEAKKVRKKLQSQVCFLSTHLAGSRVQGLGRWPGVCFPGHSGRPPETQSASPQGLGVADRTAQAQTRSEERYLQSHGCAFYLQATLLPNIQKQTRQ